jgi:hypothetical protein
MISQLSTCLPSFSYFSFLTFLSIVHFISKPSRAIHFHIPIMSSEQEEELKRSMCIAWLTKAAHELEQRGAPISWDRDGDPWSEQFDVESLRRVIVRPKLS